MPATGGPRATDTAASAETNPPPPDEAPAVTSGRGEPIWTVALVVLAAGIGLHGVRAVLGGWIPAGDDGYWAIMARSVFSSRPPLLGSSSSGGLTSGTGFHHLGPLGFYVLAPFVALFGGVGVAVGAAAVNTVSAVLAAVAARRGVSHLAGWIVLSGSAALALVMGSELLVDPWNPHLAVMPFWFGLCATWAVLRGAAGWAAPAMFALSFTAQTHLSFVPLTVVAAVAVVTATVWWCRRYALAVPRRVGPGRTGGAGAWRPLIVAAAVTAVANLPVLLQQLLAAGRGNLTAVLEGGADQGPTVGVGAGLGLVSQSLLQPWNWAPGSWRHHVVGVWDFAPPVTLVLVLVALAGLLWSSAAREGAPRVPELGLASVLLVVGAGVATTLPHRLFGVPMSLARWVWPLGLFVQAVAVVAAVDLLSSRVAPRRADGASRTGRSRTPGLLGCATVVLLTAWNLPARDEGSGAAVRSRDAITAVIADAAPDLAGLERPFVRVPVERIANDTTVALLDWFDERGVAFALDDPVALRQAGEHRRSDGTETATVLVRGGPAVLDDPPEGFTTLAARNPVSDVDAEWYRSRMEELGPRLASFRERLVAEEGFRESLGVVEDSPEDLAELGWYMLLCMSQTALPTGSATVQQELIGDDDRARLCLLDDRFSYGAVSISVGPAPR